MSGRSLRPKHWLAIAGGLLVALVLVHFVQNLLVRQELTRIGQLGGHVRSYGEAPLVPVTVRKLLGDHYVLRSSYEVAFGNGNHYYVDDGEGLPYTGGAWPPRDGGNAGIEAASQLSHVTILHASRTTIDNLALPYLGQMQELNHLNISDTRVTGELHQLPASITRLNLARTPLGPNAVSGLTHLVRLRWLNLSGTCFDGEQLAALAQLPALSDLLLNNSCIDSHHLRHLRGSSIQLLALDGTRIDDGAVEHLAAMPKLRQILADRSILSDAAARRSPHPALQNLVETRALMP